MKLKIKTKIASGFTLVELLVVMVLLSLIVLVLMGVFSSTQQALRTSVTQTGVQEGGRAALDLMAQDLKVMSASLGASNSIGAIISGQIPVNFYANSNANNATLVQSLVGSTQARTNLLENFFILSRENTTWKCVAYIVDSTSTTSINPLYRFSATATDPTMLFTNFIGTRYPSAGWSHLIDGVVDLRVRAYDTNGVLITSASGINNIYYPSPQTGDTGFFMLGDTLPATVDIQMTTLEDRVLQHAEVFSNPTLLANYLSQQAGAAHVFRQRVSVPNVDPSAYH